MCAVSDYIAIILPSTGQVTTSEEAATLLQARAYELLEQEPPREAREAVDRHPEMLVPSRPSLVQFQRGTLEALMVREAWLAGEDGCTAELWNVAVREFARKSGNRDHRTLGTVPAAVLKAVRRNCNKKLAVIGLRLAPRRPPTLIPLRPKREHR